MVERYRVASDCRISAVSRAILIEVHQIEFTTLRIGIEIDVVNQLT